MPAAAITDIDEPDVVPASVASSVTDTDQAERTL